MINIIEKILKFTCQILGMVILGTFTFCALCGDFGIIPMKVVLIALAVIAILSFTDIFKNLNKTKETPLFGDKD